MTQVDLFGKKVERWHSKKWKQRMQEVEEHNQRCAEKREKSRLKSHTTIDSKTFEDKSREGSFPCPIAQQFPVGEMRRKHIENCDECKKLERELDRSVGVTEHVYS